MNTTFRLLSFCCISFFQLYASAADFAVSISPPRFEMQVKPAEKSRQVIEITNAANQASRFKIKTADWYFAADGTVMFQDELAPQSCRPWVALEKLEVLVPAKRSYRFRFEVSPPPGVSPVECRFAVLIEGEDQTVNTGSLSIPYSGRFGVIVYAAVGDVSPKLEFLGGHVQLINGKSTAVLKVKNTGTAHARLEGFMTGVDALGKTIDFAATPLPILPGGTMDIPLISTRPGSRDDVVDVHFPVSIKGTLEWGTNLLQSIDQRFSK